MEVGAVNQPDPWVQTVSASSQNVGEANHLIEPEAGRASITYTKFDGTVMYWDGSAFVSSDPGWLATTIQNTYESYLAYTHLQETHGHVVTFKGQIQRNGIWIPNQPCEKRVLVQGNVARLKF